MERKRISRLWADPVLMGFEADGRPVWMPGLWRVRWQSPVSGRIRIYVNGALAASSDVSWQRELLVSTDPGKVAVIEAVWDGAEPADPLADGSLISVGWQADNRWPDSTTVCVIDLETGRELYREPLWDGPWEKWGLGTGRFGEQDFGYDGGGSPGMFRGSFGLGGFGFDRRGRELVLTGRPGLNRLAVRFEDAKGELLDEQIHECHSDPVPETPVLAWDGYDAATGRIRLRIS